MLHSYFRMLLVSFTLLLFTPAQGEMSLSISSSLDTFSYDLDNINLKLEKLSTRWQLSPSGDGKLQVDQLKAKRLTIKIRNNPKSTQPPLPNRITLPFPISIQQAEIGEVIFITADEKQTFNNVHFTFEGNAKTLQLKLVHADTPWGNTMASLNVSATKPFSLTGEVSLKKTDSNMPYELKALLSGDLSTLRFESDTWLTQQDGKLSIGLANKIIDQTIAHIVVNGQLRLAKDYPIAINAQINALRPELLGNYPTASLNIDLNLQGKLQPTPTATIVLVMRDSQWQNQPIAASANLQITGTQIEQLDFQAAIATNHIQASGSLGKPDSHLTWQADLADLTAFSQDYTGNVRANGTLDGAFDTLALHLELAAQKLQLPGDLKIETLKGQATLTAGEKGKVEGDFKASAIEYGKNAPANGHATIQGSRIKHQLVVSAQGKDIQFEGVLQGGLSADNIWQGVLQQLEFTGKTPAKLTAPATLHIDSNSVKLEQAVIQLAKGRASVDLLHIDDSKIISRGQLNQLTLEDLPTGLFNLPNTLQGSPVFSGKWDINAAKTLNADFSLWREAGDFTLNTTNGSSTQLGLTKAKIAITVINNHAELSAELAGEKLGYLNANLTTTLTKVEAGFALLASSPLTLNGIAQLNTLTWLPLPTSLIDAELDGQFTLSVSANGTLGKPNLSGNVTGKNLRFSLPSEGVNLSQGNLLAEFQNDQLRIKQASWQGGKGSINTSGALLLEHDKPKIDLDWNADNFTLLSRTDRQLTLSGTGKTTLADGMLTITGKFTVDQGIIELSKEDAPVLGDDVVILGQVASIKAPSLQILLNGLHIDLGQNFTLRGRGLNAELIGALTLTGLTQYHPHTEGSIQVKKGTYMAYGQVLNIERGILNFNGPMDNPGLNIRAMRNSKPINAGVEITGSAFIPVTKLVSDPNVAESEKLSWLVLGHGMDKTGKNDYGMLSLAAGVLLSQGQSVPLQTQLARAAGLDEFSFAGGDAESATLVFGKRLTSQLYLSYEKSVTGLLDVARLTFNITPRWSLRAEAGTDSAVDVLYTFSFK
jgi:translocation and assembly module TamB